MLTTATRFERVKRAAINRDWDKANAELHAFLIQVSDAEKRAIVAELLVLAADCEKLRLMELALWAYEWVTQIAPANNAVYSKLATYYERNGQQKMALEWLKRGLEMANSDDSRQQLQRHYRRVYRGH